MKKVLALLLAALMCLSFVACDSEKDKSSNELLLTYEGKVVINGSRFGECIEVVELTVENWKEYIDVFSYTEEIVEKDAFGEVISTRTFEHRIIGVETDRYHRCEAIAIELKNTETEELTIFNFSNARYEPYLLENHSDFVLDLGKAERFDISKYECTRIKGRIYFVTFPEGSLQVVENGEYCFWIQEEFDGGTSIREHKIDQQTKEIYHDNTENWQEKYMTK